MVCFPAVTSAAILLVSFVLYQYIWTGEATLIASSEVNLCGRDKLGIEPRQLDGKKCSKKFVVALTVENGKVSTIT